MRITDRESCRQENKISIAETYVWEFPKKTSHHWCRLSLEFQLIFITDTDFGLKTIKSAIISATTVLAFHEFQSRSENCSENGFAYGSGLQCVNGRRRFGGQTAGDHRKAFPRPRQPLFAVPALRELDSALQGEHFMRCRHSTHSLLFRGFRGQAGSTAVCDPNPLRPFARYKLGHEMQFSESSKEHSEFQESLQECRPHSESILMFFWNWGGSQACDTRQFPKPHLKNWSGSAFFHS